jgi:hypothetical protein
MATRSIAIALFFLGFLLMPTVASAQGGHGQFCIPHEFPPGFVVSYSCAANLQCRFF